MKAKMIYISFQCLLWLMPFWSVQAVTDKTTLFQEFMAISSKSYSTRHGLPSSHIEKVFQDKYGFIWVCTQQGLARYDGQDFTVYNEYPKEVSVYTYASFIDENEDIWIGTTNGMAVLHDYEYRKIPLDIPGTRHEIIDMLQDAEGACWFICNNLGPYVMKVDSEPVNIGLGTELEKAYIYDLVLDDSGRLWIASSKGVFIYSEGKVQQYNIPGYPSVNAYQLLIHSDGSGIVAETSGSMIIFSSGKAEKIRLVPENEDLMIYSLSENPIGGVWIGTSKGLFVYRDGNIEHFTVSDGITSNLVFDVYFDREGILWYSSDNGLGKIFGLQFRQIVPSRDLPIATVHDIDQDNKLRIWIATSEGVVRLDDRNFKRWQADDGLNDDFIMTILCLKDNDVLVSNSGGLFKIHNDKVFPIDEEVKPVAYEMVEGPSGTVWIGASEGIYKLEQNKVTFMNDELNLPGLVEVSCIFFDNHQNMWVSTDGQGVYRIDSQTETAVKIQNLPSENVFTVYQDQKNYIWIGTLEGACLLEDTDVKVIYTMRHGLKSNNIWSIRQDLNGDMWFATSKGLSCLKSGRILNYDVEDGVSGDDMVANCNLTDHMNRIWFGGTGITIIDPGYSLPITEPLVYIKRALVDDRPLQYGEILPHNLNNVDFNFVCLSFANENRNQYRYQLYGYDRFRSQPTSSPHIRYTNLPTGKYRLVVDAINRNGIFSKSPATFEFEILPAWWELYWVRVSGAVLLAMFIYSFARLRSITIRRRAQWLQKEVDRQTEVITNHLETLEKQKEKLEKLSITDDLTNIYNRRYFFRVLMAEWKRQERYKRSLSIILFDIDHFKGVNDTYGHAVGDEVLIKVVQIMKRNLRETDTLARFGGEEFIVLLPETGLDTAVEVAERIRASVESLSVNFSSYQSIKVHISGGVSTKFGETGAMNPDALVRQADIALYRAKQSGRNQISAYIPE
ncbi:diguanylate cyclase [bacterium]|nr:diguanylate cyclase [candidate division CSSED10-310 bacterium]